MNTLKKLKLILLDDYIIDATGKEFRDPLTRFLKWWGKNGTPLPQSPVKGSMSFVEGVTGVVLYRHGPWQVQMFTATPNCYIPPHIHPHVDSYEVGVCGMEFYHEDDTVVTMEQALTPNKYGVSLENGGVIRVKPNDKHGALASPEGGCFLSVQHWNNREPSTVGDDWVGQTMGPKHDARRS